MTEEQVIIVDENDNEVGIVPRSEMQAKNLRARGSAVFVFNSKGEIFVHQRTFQKDFCPGYYDLRVGGVVTSGETYHSNALRELKEELGVSDVPLKELFLIKTNGPTIKVIHKVFKCIYDGHVKPQKSEIIHGKFVSQQELKVLMQKEKFIPEALTIFNKYLEEYHDN